MNKIRRLGVHLLYKALKVYIFSYKREPVFKPEADKEAEEDVSSQASCPSDEASGASTGQELSASDTEDDC